MTDLRRKVNICIAVAVLAAWLMMAFGGKGTLAENGFGNLKYFTVLSNLFEGIASIIWLLAQRGDGAAAGDAAHLSFSAEQDLAERLKFAAAASVMLTFTTVVVFLGPLYGYANMFIRANLFFHLLVPLAAGAEIVFLTDREFTRRDNNIALIPPVIYGIVYIGNIMLNGIGEWPDSNDWYLFFAWGYPVGTLILACLALATWLLALLMRKLQQRRLRRQR